jgi:hypothetical protein
VEGIGGFRGDSASPLDRERKTQHEFRYRGVGFPTRIKQTITLEEDSVGSDCQLSGLTFLKFYLNPLII